MSTYTMSLSIKITQSKVPLICPEDILSKCLLKVTKEWNVKYQHTDPILQNTRCHLKSQL